MNAQFEILDPYQVVARKQIENYFSQNTGQFISNNSATYSSTVFQVALSELCPFFEENPYIFLGLGQNLRLVVKFTQAQECIMQCIGAGNPI